MPKNLVETYAQQLQKTYKNVEVRVTATQGGKNVAEVTKKANSNLATVDTNAKTVAVQDLVTQKIVTFKANDLTQQLSVLLDSTKLTGELKGKAANQFALVIDNQTFIFEANPFKKTQFEVINTDFTESN